MAGSYPSLAERSMVAQRPARGHRAAQSLGHHPSTDRWGNVTGTRMSQNVPTVMPTARRVAMTGCGYRMRASAPSRPADQGRQHEQDRPEDQHKDSNAACDAIKIRLAFQLEPCVIAILEK
jgi:hypothetical protein